MAFEAALRGVEQGPPVIYDSAIEVSSSTADRSSLCVEGMAEPTATTLV
ncbi:MAG TPA: hypothetical protein VF086_18590 [Propionibacteriaceae bacterium]